MFQVLTPSLLKEVISSISWKSLYKINIISYTFSRIYH